MAITIHKPGQGYWVRVLTAVLIGLVTVALALWLYSQGQLAADLLPKRQWQAAIIGESNAAAITPGTQVQLFGSLDKNGKPSPLGTGTFAGTSNVSGGQVARLENVRIEKSADGKKRDGSEIGLIKPVATTGAADASITVKTARGQAPIDGQLLGGALLAAVLVAGCVIGYWLVGVRVKTVEWLIACDYEMSRVNWSTRQAVMGSTWVVIGACVLLALVIFVSDYGLRTLFAAIKLI